MNSLILVSLILSVLLGIFRGIDLTFWTDAETGLCVVGPVWLRYAALAAVVGIAVAAGRGGQPKPDALRGRCIPSSVAALAAAVCYGAAAVLRILWMHSSVVMLLRAVLEALCAFWMLGLGLSWLRKDWKAPTGVLRALPVLGGARRGADADRKRQRRPPDTGAAVPAGAVLRGCAGGLVRRAVLPCWTGCINVSAAGWLNCSKQHTIPG